MAIKKYKTSPSCGPELPLGIEYPLEKKEISIQVKRQCSEINLTL